jgi:hypothetical protein
MTISIIFNFFNFFFLVYEKFLEHFLNQNIQLFFLWNHHYKSTHFHFLCQRLFKRSCMKFVFVSRKALIIIIYEVTFFFNCLLFIMVFKEEMMN